MTIFHFKKITLAACLAFLSLPAFAGEADVVAATIERTRDDTFRFDVSVSHADEGWDHYADAFEILDSDGKVLGTRVLAHPHVGEQPFTRSLSGVSIPFGMVSVFVRAHDSVHGTGGKVMELKVPPPHR